MKNVGENKCMDTLGRELRGRMGLYTCHGQGGQQFFAFAKTGEIITVAENCVGTKNNAVILIGCTNDASSQLWKYEDKV